MAVCLLIFFKAHYSRFSSRRCLRPPILPRFLESQPGLKWTPPDTRSQSHKVWVFFYNFLHAGWWMCASDCKMHQTARPDFIFSLLSQPNFTSLILSFSLQLGQVAVPLTAERERKSLYRGSDISLLPPNPPYHMFIHTHTYTVQAQLQAENGPNHVAVKNALFIPASSS